jgi:flagellar motor switch/type III secretory pathway protein FliN
MSDDESTMALERLPEPAELRRRMELLGLGATTPSPAPAPIAAPVSKPAPVRPAPTPVRAVPYPWEALPRLEGRQVATLNRLLGILPGGRERGALALIEAELEALTGQVCTVRYHGARLHPAPGAQAALGDVFVTLCELPPDVERGVLSIDLGLVDAALRAMLGEDGAPRHLAPLGGRDFGLVTYGLLRGLEAMSRGGEMAPLVFGASAPGADEVRRALMCGLDVAECAFHVRMASGAQGWTRLWLPSHLIQNMELFFMRPALSAGERAQLEHTQAGQAPVRLQVIAGVVALEPAVLAGLSGGDVIFFDEHGVATEQDAAPNRARLYTRGPGSPWAWASCQIGASGRWEVVPRSGLEQPRTTGSEQMAQEQAELGAAMAQEVPVLVEVRLGALTMPIAALTRLTPGQVLTMQQPVGSPVEVLAGGRVLALGELVSVEGRVGVRLTQVRG